MPRVFITGIGIISAIGRNCTEVLHSLRSQHTGVGSLSYIDTAFKNEIPVAEIKADNKELHKIADAGIRIIYSRTALLGIIAARQAVHEAGLTPRELKEAGIISGTTVGGMDTTESFYKTYMLNHSKGKIRSVAGHDCGDSTERIAVLLGIKGFLSTYNTACSSSANAIMLGARLIKQGRLKRAVVGGTDSLTRFTINGFNSLMILDREQCKPFDQNRNGLNLGEGSAFLVLESEEVVAGKTVLGEITGYGNACDAYHQTASSPEGTGAFLSMQKALNSAGINPSEIDYINTHGTGTKNNDLSEGIAIERLFENSIPPCSSTKSYTGHTLGAAGAIEAVLSTMAITQHCIYPNLNYHEQMSELHFEPVKTFRENASLRHIMSNSFGFGGNNSSLIISRV